MLIRDQITDSYVNIPVIFIGSICYEFYISAKEPSSSKNILLHFHLTLSILKFICRVQFSVE